MGSLHPIFTRICKELEPDAIFTTHGYQLVSSSGNAYYIKLGSANNYEQWRGEAESLRAMHEAAPGLAPKLFAFGVTDEDGNDVEPGTPGTRTYFISTYSDHTGLTDRSAVILGRRIASEMHCHESPNGKFGFEVPTYCGATKFSNGWYDTWAECFSAMIAQMLGYLQARGEFESLQEKGRNVQERVIPYLLGSLDIKPVLLHGDLWSGNTGANRHSGEPVIFDAASYYGHNEADLGITRMFGGVPRSFFTTYHEHMPKTEPVDQYELRAELYEMLHYLNHTVLFGGGYASTAEKKMTSLLRRCP